MPDVTALDSSDILNLLDAIAVKSQKITESIKGTGETSTKHMKAAGEAVTGLDKGVSSLSKSLLGPVGLAAGFVAVAKSLDNFAVGQLQLNNLARNTGFASSAVLSMQAQFQRAGMSVAEANQQIAGFGASFADIAIFREGSPVLHQIAEGSPKLAADLLKAKDNGERLSAVMVSYDRARDAGNLRWMLMLEKIFNTTRTGMDVLKDQQENHVRLWTYTDAESRKYHITLTNISNTLTNIGGSIAQKLITELGKVTGSFNDMDSAAKQFRDDFNKFFDETILPYIRTTIQEYRILVGLIETAQKNYNQPKPPITKEVWEGALQERRTKSGAERYMTEDFDIKSEMLSSGSKIKDFGRKLDQWFGTGKRSALEGDTVEMSARTHTEEDSNKQLHGIYDILARQEIKLLAGGGGSGGGGGTPGSGGSGPIFRPGVGGMGGTRGNRNNNRGNIKFGEFAKSMGAVGADDRGFAIFPDQATGDAAHAALVKQPQYQGLTLEQFGNKYAEGSADWKRTVGSALGIGPGDIVNTTDSRLLEGIRRAEGTASGGRMDPMAPAGMRPIGGQGVTSIASPSGRTFTVAKEFARNFQGFINDYEGAGGVIGPSSGGVGSRGNPSYHPLGRAIDINQEGYGIRSRSGVTLPQDVEDRLAQKWGLFPGSQFKSRSDIGHFEVRNAELAAEARARLDKNMSSAAPNGHLSADITFGNIPPGVKTNAEGKGFKTLRVTSSKQNQQATEGLLGPGDLQYTPFVP